MARDFTPNAYRTWRANTGTNMDDGVVNYPYTISAFFNIDGISGDQYIVSVFNVATVRTGHIGINSSGSLIARQTVNQGTTADYAVTGVTVSPGNWYHGAAVFNGSSSTTTSRVIYLNGNDPSFSSYDKQTTTSTVGLGGSIGAVAAACLQSTTSSRSSFFDGKIAEIGFWRVALSDDEIRALARGIPPLQIRPDQLAIYIPLIRDVVDFKNTWEINQTSGTQAAFDHPRRYY